MPPAPLGALTKGLLCTVLLGPAPAMAPMPAAHPPDWTLHVNYPAVILALQVPYNTVQLAATARTRTGAPLPGASRPVFRASDSCVTVSATGLVTARTPTQSRFKWTMFWKTTTFVVVSVTAQGVTLEDTAWIQVTPTPLPHAIKTFSMQPASGDSAKWGRNEWDGADWHVLVTDVAGDTLCHRHDDKCPLLIQYLPYLLDGIQNENKVHALEFNRHTLSVCGNLENSGFPSSERLTTDTVTLTATTLAYGVELKDSVVFRLGLPVSGFVAIEPHMRRGVLTPTFIVPFRASESDTTGPVTVGVGATLMFVNMKSIPYDVVFDHPEAVDTASCSYFSEYGRDIVKAQLTSWGSEVPTGRGNIPAVAGDSIHGSCAARRFTKPGIYRFHSTMVPTDTIEVRVISEH